MPLAQLRLVAGDTDLTADAGKTSASRQTFVSGNAAKRAGEDLRRQILQLRPTPARTRRSSWRAGDDHLARQRHHERDRALPIASQGTRQCADRYGPLRSADDTPRCQWPGEPYATYAFAAQIAEVEVDLELGTAKLRRIVAAHDVGRAINPILVEGQIQAAWPKESAWR